MNFFCVVENSSNGISLLQFLKKYLPDFSNRKIKELLERGCVSVNGIVERFGSKRLSLGDSINFQNKLLSYTSNLDILFEDEHFLSINKPINFESNSFNIEKYFPGCHLVHRLDKNTTGALLIAKTLVFKKQIERCFKERQIQKNYVALVDGTLDKESGVIESYLKRIKHYQGQTIWGSCPSKRGLYAKTIFKKIKIYSDFSYVLLTPITGRTHQLRVHLKELNHPILGDFQYCRKFNSQVNVNSLCLHASKISFIHPITNKAVIIEAPLPETFSFVK